MLSSKALISHAAAAASVSRSFSRTLAAQAGTVKFYLRDKGYGFIQPDSHPDTDVFVHRNNIDCTHEIPADVFDQSNRYPYLKMNERVLFELAYEKETGLRKAQNVTWLNGSKIPPERRNYLGGVHERAKRILGEELYKVMSDEEQDDATLLRNVKEQFSIAKASIQGGEDIIRRLGMDVADFPTEKSRLGRGKYMFHEGKESTEMHSSSPAVEPEPTFHNVSIEEELEKLAKAREKKEAEENLF